MSDLARLRNLGSTVCHRLAEVGIRNARALESIGPAQAYVRMVRFAGRPLPVCYYLYSLEGALRGDDWSCLSKHEKERLRSQAGLPPAPKKRMLRRGQTSNGPPRP